MKQVLHITTVPLSLTFLRGQAAFMRHRGLDIMALTSPGEEVDAFSKRESVHVFTVDMKRRISPLSDLVSVWRIRNFIRFSRPLIVHAQTPKGGLLGMLASWLAGSPVRIYHIRGLPFVTMHGWRRMLMRTTEQISCALAQQVLCVSHSVRAVAIEEGVCSASKITVLASGSGNGVDAEGRFNPQRLPADTRKDIRIALSIPTDAVVVGFVGRIVRDKGVPELATAWQQLRTQYSNVHLLLVGPVEERDAVAPETMEALSSDPRVHFMGKQSETPPLYAAMDVAVLPSRREGFPNVPLEAAAMGLPVITTNVPGCIDAVEAGVTGLLVTAGNGAELAAAMRGYINDAALRERHGKAGRERVLRLFRPEIIWSALFDVYASLAKQRGIPLRHSSAELS